jgi:hypothetical protein
MTRQAGEMYGRFHCAMNCLKYKFALFPSPVSWPDVYRCKGQLKEFFDYQKKINQIKKIIFE